MALTESQIQELYVAYFGRPADVEGKAYWSGSATGVSTVLGFAANMHSQSEFQDAYGSKKTATQVNQIYQNLFSRDADAAGLEYWTGQIADGSLKLAEIAVHLIWAAKNNTGGSADKTALENKVAAATAFTTDVAADATAQLAYTADDADAFTTAKTFITGVTTTAATAAEIDTQVTSIKSTYTTNDAKGVTYTLATTADDITGGTKNDTFAGVVDADTASNNTFSALDSIDGGAGTDTLAVTFASDAGNTNTFPAATITNIENFSIKNQDDDDAVTVNFANITGEAVVNNNLSTSEVTFSNLAAGTNVDITGNGSLTNGATTITHVAATTASTIDIIGGTTDGNISDSQATGSNLVTTTITSTGAANTVGTVGIDSTVTALNIDATTDLTTGAITAAGVTTLTITGAGDVDINAGALGAATDVIDASAATGDVDVLAGNVADNTGVSADITITTGSGADAVSLAGLDAADEVSVTLGAGNDSVYIDEVIQASSTTSPGDVLTGGAGTDTLQALTATLDGHATTTTVTGFEVVEITDEHSGSLDVADFGTGITTVTLAAGSHSGNAGDISFNAGSSVLNFKDVNNGTLTLTAAGTAATDSLSINITDTSNVDVLGGTAITTTEIENITLDTTHAGSTATGQDITTFSMSANTGGVTKLTIIGSNTLALDEVTANTIDASGATAAISQSTAMVGTASGTNVLKGGSGADTLVGDANDTTNIDGNAGNDNISGGTDTETINGGAGNDTINSSTGADTISGGAGNDTITIGAATQTVDAGDGDDTVNALNFLAYGYSVAGGAGTDILDVTAAEVIGDASVVTGFEQLNIDGNVTIDLDTYSNNTFSTVQLETHTYTLQSVRSEVIQLIEVLAGDLTVTREDTTNVPDTVSFKLKATAMFDTGDGTNADIDVDSVANINIETDDSDDATFGAATFQMDGDDTTTLTITGDSGVVLTGSALTALQTINGSGATIGGVSTASTIDGITWASDNSTSGAVTSYTGTNGVDSFTGLATSDDTFIGGLGADTLVYNGRKDTFTGGGGNDVFDLDITTAGVAATSTAFLTITDLTAGDTINWAGAHVGTSTWNATEVTLGSSATLANYLDTAAAASSGASASIARWFEYSGDTYICQDESNNTTYTAGTDWFIKISGSVDLGSSTLSGDVLTIV